MTKKLAEQEPALNPDRLADALEALTVVLQSLAVMLEKLAHPVMVTPNVYPQPTYPYNPSPTLPQGPYRPPTVAPNYPNTYPIITCQADANTAEAKLMSSASSSA